VRNNACPDMAYSKMAGMTIVEFLNKRVTPKDRGVYSSGYCCAVNQALCRRADGFTDKA